MNEALANNERLARLIKFVGLALALYIAVAVTIASVFGVANSLRSVEHAREGAAYAQEALNQARTNTDIATDVKMLVAQQKPCLEGDPPDSPGCVRQARSNAVVAEAIADIKAALTASIDTHDLNAKAVHDQLLKHHAMAAPKRTPITSAPRRSAKPAPTTATASPAPSTTTTCPKRGKSEKCR